jgi:hypothetical protein
VVVRVQDVKPPLRVHDQRPGLIQFAAPPPVDAPSRDEPPVSRELLDAVIPELGDINMRAVQPQIIRIT